MRQLPISRHTKKMVSEPLYFAVTSFLRYEQPPRRYRGPSGCTQCKITVSPPLSAIERRWVLSHSLEAWMDPGWDPLRACLVLGQSPLSRGPCCLLPHWVLLAGQGGFSSWPTCQLFPGVFGCPWSILPWVPPWSVWGPCLAATWVRLSGCTRAISQLRPASNYRNPQKLILRY